MAQYVTTGPNGQVAPAGSTVVVVGNGGGPILSTPSVTFGTPPAAAGISLADRAGISNITPTNQNIPSASESFPIYSNTNQPNAGTTPYPATGESTAVTAANAASSGRLINDMGPSYFTGTAPIGGAGNSISSPAVAAVSGLSLGEIAAKYKSGRPQNMRTYTNADAQRLSDSINVHGANITPANAQNTAPAGTQTASPVAIAQSSAAPASTNAQPQLSASMRPSPAIRGEMMQSSAGAQSGSATQSSTSASTGNSAQATQSGATTPQISQPSGRTENNNQGTANRLPASSTLLPLFGLLGLASGGIGIWLKYRR
jgi:hypothetical protein